MGTKNNNQQGDTTMRDMRQVMTAAWTIRRAAAQKWNVKVSEVSMASCLKLAWTKPTMTTAQKLAASKEAVKTNRFTPNPNIDRTYITLRGADRSYRGDNGTKVYLDNKTGLIVIEKAAKGMTSRSFDSSLEAFKAEMGL
jgi:hypothetical protein